MLNKVAFLHALKHFLFGSLKQQLGKDLSVIYDDQSKLVPVSEVGFYYKGKGYMQYTAVEPKYKYRAKPLDPSLHKPMEEYLTTTKKSEEEWDYISSYARCLLNQCSTASQLYLALPTGLHGFLHQYGIEGSMEEPTYALDIGNNQIGKELLITRLMLNMTGG